MGYFRGNLPRAPAMGSPGPSGPGRLFVLAGEVDNFGGSEFIDIRAFVTERFSYMR